MKVNVVWGDAMTFTANGPSGHAVIMDVAPEMGGQNLGPRPMELLLYGVGACTGIDIVMILQKARQPIEGLEMEVEAERAEEHPKRFTKVHIHYKLTGSGLDPERVRRAVDLSVQKYCSAVNSLNAEVTYDFEIVAQ